MSMSPEVDKRLELMAAVLADEEAETQVENVNDQNSQPWRCNTEANQAVRHAAFTVERHVMDVFLRAITMNIATRMVALQSVTVK